MTTSERKTEVLYGAENTTQRGVFFMSNVRKEADVCMDNRAPSIVIHVDEFKNSFRDIRKRGGKIKLLAEITSENINYCKQLMELVDELRHLDGIKGGFIVSEIEYMATTVFEEGQPLTQVIYSNVKEVVEQAQFIFDSLWNNSAAMPAKQRLKELEYGAKREFVETIRDSAKAQKLAFDLVKIALEEILIIFPTIKAFYLEERIGIRELLTEAANKRGVRIRMLIGTDELTIKEMEKLNTSHEPFNIHPFEFSVQAKMLVIVVDKALSLTMELRECAEDPNDRIGLATYSNSESIVLSYVSLFETTWVQRELREGKKETAS